jgi:ribonucleoside-diphosphate reductase alpha chain
MMSDVVVYGKYARHDSTLKRRENWDEIVTRNALMHIKKYPELADEIPLVYQDIYAKRIVPSMRSMQFAGKPIELSPNRMFNCAYLAMDSYKAFREVMFLLLGGSGVGFSVQARHTSQLPEIKAPRTTVRYVIQDSITGWADAVDFLMKAYFTGGQKPLFDFSDIREKGAVLVTSGGKAPGPAPLEKALFEIELILKRAKPGYKLRTLEVFDINCHIANAVLAGGIRRSAMITLFDHDDEDMLTSKNSYNINGNEQRYRANISAILHREHDTREDFNRVFDRLIDGNGGEPGFFFTNDYEYGTNPLTLAA